MLGKLSVCHAKKVIEGRVRPVIGAFADTQDEAPLGQNPVDALVIDGPDTIVCGLQSRAER